MQKVKINDNITIIKGDCLGVMKELADIIISERLGLPLFIVGESGELSFDICNDNVVHGEIRRRK